MWGWINRSGSSGSVKTRLHHVSASLVVRRSGQPWTQPCGKTVHGLAWLNSESASWPAPCNFLALERQAFRNGQSVGSDTYPRVDGWMHGWRWLNHLFHQKAQSCKQMLINFSLKFIHNHKLRAFLTVQIKVPLLYKDPLENMRSIAY